jgi:hypothetical protein
MTVVVTKSSLSPQRRRLLEICQQVGFGRVEHLVFEDREPSFDPPPRIVREIKFGGENGPRPELTTADFLLKQQVVELFAFFDEQRNGVIDVLEVKHGLPFRVIVTEVPA